MCYEVRACFFKQIAWHRAEENGKVVVMITNTVTLNGETADVSIITKWIEALNDECIIREKAGFLFKATFDGEHLMLAVAPCLIHGERSLHYKLKLEKMDAFTLVGSVNAQGVFTLLFKPDSMEQLRKESAHFIEVCRRFSTVLLEQGYTAEGLLDEVTQGVLQNLGLSPAPKRLADLYVK